MEAAKERQDQKRKARQRGFSRSDTSANESI
jgi:hypothetical protein